MYDEFDVVDCPLCDVIAGNEDAPGGIVFENDQWAAWHHVDSSGFPGQIIVAQKRHAENLTHMSLDESMLLGPAIANISFALSQVVRPARIYVYSFSEHIRHNHFFVVPRMSDMSEITDATVTRHMRQFLLKKSYSQDELAWFALQVRSKLMVEDEF